MPTSMPSGGFGDASGRWRGWPLIAGLLLCVCPTAFGQLTPTRTYYGVRRSIPMQVASPASPPVQRPEGEPAPTPVPAPDGGEIRIDLFLPGKDTPEATAPVLEGPVDMAALFPLLWNDPTPRVHYAQLVVGGVQVGPPVVLEPLVTRPRATLIDPRSRSPWFVDPTTNSENFRARDGVLEWATRPPTFSGLRAYVDQHVVLNTSLGEIEARLRPDEAPNTAWNFRELVRGGFYTDVIVHRVVAKLPSGHPFVIQAGDPTGTGEGDAGYAIDLERSTLAHDFGVLSMARDTGPNTNGSQFFIALSREGTQTLDGKYTAFGEVVRGAQTIMAISRVPVKDQRPLDPPVIIGATLVDAPVYDKRPARVQRPKEDKGR